MLAVSGVISVLVAGEESDSKKCANFCAISSSNVTREGMNDTREAAAALVSIIPSVERGV